MATSTIKQETLERKRVKKKMSKAQMQLAIIKKKQCDAKALIIVEQLLEPTIDRQWLLDNLRYINTSHMEDVIEERAIIKLCGYVLCSAALTTVIDQRYHISMKKNKVYDVTRRKNFCSSRCYGACNYLLEQMFTSPLWLRDKEEIPVFKILPEKDELERSTPGDEILVTDPNVMLNSNNKNESVHFNETLRDSGNASVCNSSDLHTIAQATDEAIEANASIGPSESLEEQFPKNSDAEDPEYAKDTAVNSEDTTSSIKQCTNDDSGKEISTAENNVSLDQTATRDVNKLNHDISLNDERNQKNDEGNKLHETVDAEYDKTVIKRDINVNSKDCVRRTEKSKSKRHKEKNCVKGIISTEFYNLAMHIECNVKEWITEGTVCLLSGEESIKIQLLEDITQHDKYVHLCKKLNKLQLEDEKDDHVDLIKNTLKPLPHLSVLQEEGKKMELKVRAFYKGATVIENPKCITEDTKQSNDFAPVLPLTDAHAPRALRRRIFLDKLNRILPDLLRALAGSRLPQHTYSSERSALIRVLVNTFSLSASNITFKTPEWTLVGLIIIKMLGMIDPELKALLSTRQASMYISMILMSYKLDSNYLDRLVMELTHNTKIFDVDNTTNI
ncbi:putative RNA polymerase II subunit B1 CTD phosphatase RPAP2 isoform X1 [Andrena cerasifolii]|uniref:putative RNA polymerase II subunit B1 CTD phosphatase RPAP2 isoform X1 n=2 Tax=Andrena cerasifolii TaxID=2819439 RepID=UPI004037F29F